MAETRSRDGTAVAFEARGAGPPVVLVGGATWGREDPPLAELAGLLGARFTVFTYGRRGRHAGGGFAPSAIRREVDDLEAVINAAGGAACVAGLRSGAGVALEAARSLAIERLALFEAPALIGADDREQRRYWAPVIVPTLLVERGRELAGPKRASAALAELLLDARRHLLVDDHGEATSGLLAPVLERFFARARRRSRPDQGGAAAGNARETGRSERATAIAASAQTAASTKAAG